MLRQTASLWQGKGNGGLHMSEIQRNRKEYDDSQCVGSGFVCTLQSGACCRPCSKHLYPCFPSVTVSSGHSPQLNRLGSDSDRHCTPRKQGSPRHTSAGFPQNFPLNPFGHRQPTTWEERTITRQAGRLVRRTSSYRWKSVCQAR